MGPDMVVGSEPWHRALPADWVPIIARDIQRQAEQEEQVVTLNPIMCKQVMYRLRSNYLFSND